MLRHVATLLTSFIIVFASSIAFANSAVKDSLIAAADTKTSGEYAFSQCRALQGKPFAADGKQKKALIIGDSYACDFLNAITENAYLQGYQISLRYIPYDCQTVMGERSAGFIDTKDRAFCAKPERADSLERAKEQMQEADLVIFASRWKPEIAQELPQTIRQLGLKPQQKVVVVGNKFFGKITVRQYLRMPANELKALQNEVDSAEAQAINAKLAKQLGKEVVFVDPHVLLCGDDTSCPVFTDDLNLISYDGRHLTKDGARYVGKVLFQRSGLGQM
jgi:hypothetical protein